MKITTYLIVSLFIFMIGGGRALAQSTTQPATQPATQPTQLKDVGELCITGTECAGGICVDLKLADGDCKAKVCTVACKINTDCPPVGAGADCEKETEVMKRVCFYDDWEKKYCD